MDFDYVCTMEGFRGIYTQSHGGGGVHEKFGVSEKNAGRFFINNAINLSLEQERRASFFLLAWNIAISPKN